MPRPFALLIALLALLAAPVPAQERALRSTLETDYPRVSQIIGSHVHNDRGESIGRIEDVVMRVERHGPIAVIQVPAIPELEARRVAVPLRDMRWDAAARRITIPGTTQRHLLNEPAFDF